MSVTELPPQDPFAQSFLRFIEEETKAETEKIMKKYQELMNKDLSAARERIVASAGVRLSKMMTIHDLGTTIRIEIIKHKEE